MKEGWGGEDLRVGPLPRATPDLVNSISRDCKICRFLALLAENLRNCAKTQNLRNDLRKFENEFHIDSACVDTNLSRESLDKFKNQHFDTNIEGL